jgi:L,D-peptidoglycan transpeptidase YkuD (ErfK/YbiS/YcfS/YnhG family)
MLGSMGTKGGIVLYHIRYGGYGITLGCPAINGVTSCCQPMCWLIGVGLITKPSCGWICYTSTPTCVIGVLGIASYREVLSSSFINCFSLSSTKGQFLNSCPTC